MARVSISEAARLVKVSRPTIYKMINSGKLSYTSVVKHGKAIKVIDTSELIRVFGSLDGVIDTVKYDVKSDAESTSINSVGLHDLQHRIALLGVSLDIENYCTLRLFFDLPNLAGLSRRNLPADGIRLLFHI